MKPIINIYHSQKARLNLLAIWSIVLGCLVPLKASVNEQIQIALKALDKQEYKQARQELRLGLKEAREQQDSQGAGKVYFYLGLTLQQQIEDQAEEHPDQVEGWLRGAQGNYERATRELPDSGGLWNNLAQIYEKQGQQDKAMSAFQRAIRIGNDQQALYAVNYADFLSRSGKDKDASRFYELALEREPINEYAQEALLDYYAREDSSKVGELLRKQLNRGQVMQVLDATVTMLRRNTRRLEREQSEELLTIVVMCLTRLSNQPQQSLRSAVDRLTPLMQGPWAEPVREIFNLYEEEENRLEPRFYGWWSGQIGPSSKSPPGGWPLEAFLELIRSLGDRLESSEDSTREGAEAYYLLALRLNQRNPDARALVKLADFYKREGKDQKVEELLNEEEDRIFGAKANAIREMDLKRRYEYHRSLGIIYGHLNKWGDEQTVQSAFFQLNNALQAAKDYNEEAKKVANQKLIIEPRLVNTLAEGYIAKDQANKAFELRTNTTYNYMQLGAAGAATQVFRPISTVSVPANIKPDSSKQYETLKKGFGESGFKTGLVGTLLIDERLRGSTDEIRERAISQPSASSQFGMVILSQPKNMRLSQRELERLANSLQSLIKRISSRKPDRDQFVLLSKEFPENVVKIVFDSKQGKIQLVQSSKTIEVPFTIKQQRGFKINAFQAVRP